MTDLIPYLILPAFGVCCITAHGIWGMFSKQPPTTTN